MATKRPGKRAAEAAPRTSRRKHPSEELNDEQEEAVDRILVADNVPRSPGSKLPGEAGYEEQNLRFALDDVIERLLIAADSVRGENAVLQQDIVIAALCMRAAIDEIVCKPPKRDRGRPPKVSKNDVARSFYVLTKVKGRSNFSARVELAEKLGISEEAVLDNVRRADPEHARWWIELLQFALRNSAE
jgi:hypothetical protein